MTGARYDCAEPGRRAALTAPGAPAGLSGIDFIEVRQGAALSDPTQIRVELVKPLPLPDAKLTAVNFRITGGVRFPAPVVSGPVAAEPGGGTVARYVLTLPGGQPTDFSTYTLSLVDGDGPPGFIDPRLAAVEFSFKVDCPGDYDCAPGAATAPAPAPSGAVPDYTARDWPALRGLMLDRMRELVPGFAEDDPADLTVTLVEALAARLDQQSYRLDWIGTEAFLHTARERRSLTRHARLVDYRPGEGASARVPVSFEYAEDPLHPAPLVLPAATPVIGRRPDLSPVLDGAAHVDLLRAGGALVFETMHEARIWPWRSRIAFHTWSDAACVLKAGATSATLVDTGGGQGPIAPGDLLVLAETRSPLTGLEADADPARRALVRVIAAEATADPLAPGLALVEVHWDAADAPRFDLVLSARTARQSGAATPEPCAAVLGNVALADHGASLPPADHIGATASEAAELSPALSPPMPLPGLPWRPVLPLADLSRIAPADFRGPPEREGFAPASELARAAPADCLPALRLIDDFSTWTARADLLSSGPFARDFVVETTIDGAAALRFGDGIGGQAPPPGAAIAAAARSGVGPAGNIGPGALAHVALGPGLAGAKLTVTNPLPGRGGAAPESAASIRLNAPEAFREQDRAVTPGDYAEAALRHPEVVGALAIPRWTGAWQTIFVHVDRLGGAPADAAFRARIAAHLEHFRTIGFDVAVRGPIPAPLDIHLSVCAAPDALRARVAAAVRAALGPVAAADGTLGFFHPDRLSFGAPVHLSALIAAAMAVPGVESVTPLRFQRFGRLADGELQAGVIRPAEAEILQLADDPSFPERGRLRLTMGGGR
ncbi:putative baseplate assembly protein [Rhodovulum sp. DZ06]|uniref:putative baseplate assembly protein n=1 Tax=Rhodovulum sp. DZ06 TaxID=3425126 RepID=UPI003D335344